MRTMVRVRIRVVQSYGLSVAPLVTSPERAADYSAMRLPRLKSLLLSACAVGAADEALVSPSQEESLAFERISPRMPDELLSHWRRGAQLYEAFLADFHATGALTEASKARLQEARRELTALSGYTLGSEREFMLAGRLMDVLAPLARDDAHCAEAASWAVQRAVHPLGQRSYATDEASDETTFNSALGAAMMYYRRAGDDERAKATLRLAASHPRAATKWERLLQTPLVFVPGLTAQPWWDATEFSLVRRLEAAYAAPAARAALLLDLDTLIAERRIARVLSPVAPLQPGSESADVAGSGAWSEAALFDGKEWGPVAAQLPTIRALLRGEGDEPVDREVCRGAVCGTDVVVSVIRLRPGARITPHCGMTNRRLTMQFALRGSDGVAFTVGGEERGYGGDGRAVVFDDSFEHSVSHRGTEDRYVLYALLRHPDVAEVWS